jgi:hypothetical protein
MPANKHIGLSVEQIQWLTDRIHAQVYGEPIGNEAVAEILKKQWARSPFFPIPM